MRCKSTTLFTARYSEFPELAFAMDDTNAIYFDATLYIENKGDSSRHSPIDFVRKFSFWIDSLKESYEIADDKIMMTDDATGHILFDESLALLFVAYIDPSFAAYITERISELFLNGIVISDSRILQLARERLSIEPMSNLKRKEKEWKEDLTDQQRQF
ncbi:MAG: hypothetical protein SNH27_10725 [Rikenellaceae bacterium]